VTVKSLKLQIEGRPDVVLDPLSTAVEPVIKEGVEYRLVIDFHVSNNVVSGLKYLHVVKKMGVKVDKMEEMLGSYSPSTGF
jgi:Rho GDP-dissociation inhibitor